MVSDNVSAFEAFGWAHLKWYWYSTQVTIDQWQRSFLVSDMSSQSFYNAEFYLGHIFQILWIPSAWSCLVLGGRLDLCRRIALTFWKRLEKTAMQITCKVRKWPPFILSMNIYLLKFKHNLSSQLVRPQTSGRRTMEVPKTIRPVSAPDVIHIGRTDWLQLICV